MAAAWLARNAVWPVTAVSLAASAAGSASSGMGAVAAAVARHGRQRAGEAGLAFGRPLAAREDELLRPRGQLLGDRPPAVDAEISVR